MRYIYGTGTVVETDKVMTNPMYRPVEVKQAEEEKPKPATKRAAKKKE